MTEFDFLARLIKKNWFVSGDKPTDHKWTFQEDLEVLKPEELKQLVILLFQCLEIKIDDAKIKNIIEALKSRESYILGDITIDKSFMFNFLVCITFSEYRIYDLLGHPQDMRKEEFKEICL